MTKVRSVITVVLYLASCAALLGAHNIATTMLKTYSEAHIESFGPRVPAFSLEIVSYMNNSDLICVGALVISIGLAVAAWYRSGTSEARLGWVAILSTINYHIAFYFVGAIAIGFFALPKLANGA